MPKVKVAFIGGGSAHWVPPIVTDFVLTEDLQRSELVLYDIDAQALELTYPLAQRIAREAGTGWRVTSTTERSAALDGADFVILCIRVGGVEAMKADLEIPLRYGIHQTVGDTVGPGGLSRALRHIPVVVEIAKEMERRCPNAWLLNLTNPMTTICRAVTKITSIPTIGICHEVPGILSHIASYLKVDEEDIFVKAGGINHFVWIWELRVDNRDVLDHAYELAEKYIAKASDAVSQMDTDDWRSSFKDRVIVKVKLFQRYGAFPAAGDRHVAEFFPYFLNESSDWGRRYGLLPTTYEFRVKELEYYRDRARALLEQSEPLTLVHSHEQLADIVAALVTGKPKRFIINYPNKGQISNLPLDAVVESFAYIRPGSVEPISVGPLPSAIQELVIGHLLRQEMTVEAALHGDKKLACQALSSDPLISNWERVPQMLDEMLFANKEYLPQFKLR